MLEIHVPAWDPYSLPICGTPVSLRNPDKPEDCRSLSKPLIFGGILPNQWVKKVEMLSCLGSHRNPYLSTVGED